MGNWNINIKGDGRYHNDLPSDADRMTSEFVERLREAGHTIEYATFISGGKLDVPIPIIGSTPTVWVRPSEQDDVS